MSSLGFITADGVASSWRIVRQTSRGKLFQPRCSVEVDPVHLLDWINTDHRRGQKVYRINLDRRVLELSTPKVQKWRNRSE